MALKRHSTIPPVLRSFLSRPVAAPFLFYLLLSVVLTWPLAVEIGSRAPKGDFDLWQNYWNVWWWDHAVRNGHSPFKTELLFHPTGASIGWHTHSPANAIASLPASWCAGALGGDGPVAAVGFATLMGFVMAGLGAHLLAREIVGPRAAVLAGVAFAFFPHHVEQSLEHLNLASYWAMPFSLLFLARAARGDGPRAWLLAGLFLAVNALLSWHNGALLAIAAVAIAAAEVVKAPRPRRGAAGVAMAGLVCCLIVLPFLWPMLAEAAEGRGGLKETVHKPVDLLLLVIPHPGHPLWGDTTAEHYERCRKYPSVGFVAYLGLSVLALSALAWAWRPLKGDDSAAGEAQARPWRTFCFWGALAVLHIVLALGRTPQVGGSAIEGVTLPFALIESIPILNTVRVANRFIVPAMLALSILAAMGGAYLAQQVRRPAPSGAITAALALLIALDFLWVPFPLRDVPRPDYIAAIEKELPGLAVLDIPTGAGPRAAEDMLQGTRHGRPIAGGYISQVPIEIQETLRKHPALQQFFFAHPPPPVPGETLAEAIRTLDIGLVVVHLDRERSRIEERRAQARNFKANDFYEVRLHNTEKGIEGLDLARIRAELNAAFGPPVYTDKDTEVFRVRE